MNTYLQYIIIIFIMIIIAAVIVKMHKKNFNIEANKLISYLGGKDNIINASYHMSRFIVILKDVSKADKDAILKLGATGVVEIDNQLKIVLGKEAKILKQYIDDII